MTGLRVAREASPLVVTTVELGPTPRLDLVDVAGSGGFLFEQEGAGLAGRGEALRIALPKGLADVGRIAAALRALDPFPESGRRGPVALGALPFDRDAPASMVVPQILVARGPTGEQWLTSVAPAGSERTHPRELFEGLGAARAESLPDSFALTSPRPHVEWEATIADAVEAIERGELQKVVVAREVIVEANRAIVVPDVLERLRALYPSCVVFSIDGFLGASPELLVAREGRGVRSHPLAGTFPRSGDPHADEVLAAELLASVKDRNEHRFVIEQIVGVLEPRCERLDVPAAPSIHPLRNVLHLGTELAGTLREPAPTALELAAALHPTPAVGGTPTEESLAWLDRHEGLARGRYAGPVGWVDSRGDGMFSVGIRSAEIRGARARLFAGVGIVEGSDPKRELVETQLKLQALLAAVVRP